MRGNTYAQIKGNMLGQYGANKNEEPKNLIFDEDIGEKIKSVMGECDGTVILLPPAEKSK
jgi:hypothetical protein